MDLICMTDVDNRWNLENPRKESVQNFMSVQNDVCGHFGPKYEL